MPDAGDSLVQLTDVGRIIGRTTLLDGISLSVSRGDRLLLLGANGAGKSTLLKIMSGLTTASSGAVLRRPEVKTGYLGHQEMLYRNLSVWENLHFFGQMSGVPTQDIERCVVTFGLTKFKDRRISDLSRGWQVRTGLARTLLNRPSLLLLDEPTAQLDGDGVSDLLSSLVRESEIAATVVATHDLARLEDWANRIIVLRSGRLIYDTNQDLFSAAKVIAREHYHRGNR